MTLTDMQTPFYRIKEADLLYDIDLLQTCLLYTSDAADEL